ncbi:TonB-dependent receptor domain-containing protein [Desertivirga brevis]|uniref:TonB-dependent receptor domain-containing protein n=1 Tax=Desertivirga brevis TaxID=2810310 RepID=UPI001A95CAA7|nr:TonB-dependent receptor [Pedobacter sp. SYSU D00873]
MLFRKDLLVFFFLLVSLVAKGQVQVSLAKPLTISFKNQSLKAALLDIQAKSHVNIAFDPGIIPLNPTITRDFNNMTVAEILSIVLHHGNLTYTIVADRVVVLRERIQYYTIDGYVTEEESGEPLIAAGIYIPELKISTLTNQYGFYSLTVPAGAYELIISHIEYQGFKRVVKVEEDKRLSFHLTIKQNKLKEVVVAPNLKPDSLTVNQGIWNLGHEQLKQIAYYAGEVDVIKALQMQNGVKALTEGSSGLFVRGGSIDQNLIMLDEAMIYNPSHLFGLVSIFNPDAIKNVQLYKDFMPASFGGRLSSVLDSRMADGNNKEFHVKGGASLLSLRAAAEGPIIRERGSFLLTFRRSLLDLINKDYRIVNPNSTYYDVNLKLNMQLDRNNKVFYSFYGGKDKLFSENSFGNRWGNLTSTFRWNHVFNSRIFFNLSAIYSDYKNNLDLNSDTLAEKKQWQTGVKDITLKGDLTFYRNPFHEVKFGGLVTRHKFNPGSIVNSVFLENNIPINKSWEFGTYVSNKYSFNDKVTAVVGLRLSGFSNAEERLGVYDENENLIKAYEHSLYWGAEPRANVSIWLKRNHFTHFTYNRNYQFLQLVQNNELAFSSLETWLPVAKKTKPQNSHHFSWGYSYQPINYSLRISTFYKHLNNQVEILEHTELIQNSRIRDFLRYGKARSYGLEVGFNRQIGKLTGGAGYTYSRTVRAFRDVNNGMRFPANFDIPNDFKTNLSYAFSNQLRLNSFFTLASGRPTTLPVGFYFHGGTQVPIYEDKNNSRFPIFHRMDLSFQYTAPVSHAAKHSWKHSFSGGVYNVYNRRNPLYYRISQATTTNSLGVVNSSTRVLPWVAYSFMY